jgi:uncharacterized RDD family membrane protein YckC
MDSMNHGGTLNLRPGIVLADPRRRLAAALLDMLIIFGSAAVVVPLVIFILGLLAPGFRMGPGWVIVSVYACMVVPFIINLYLLENHGQTIGKRLLKLKIVHESGARPSSDRLIFFRQILPAMVFNTPIFGYVLFVVDSVFIFTPERQCLHDKIAQTIVIDLRPVAAA